MERKQDREPELFFLSLPADRFGKSVSFFADSVGDWLYAMRKGAFRSPEHSRNSGLQRFDGR